MGFAADKELITQTMDGSNGAFDKLMTGYQKQIFRISLNFGKNKENALDITQNVFLKAYENLKSFQGKSSFKTWLLRIAYNEGNNWIRKHKREINNEIYEDEMMTINSPSQEDDILAQENRSLLLRCLLDLNTRYRLAVVLRYFENQPLKEIASTMDCSEGVVKNMLFRSMQKLRESLPAEKMGGLV